MPKTAPQKCINCAKLSAEQAKRLHGPAGSSEHCWDSKLCPNRRSHLRHRDRRNLKRNLERWNATGGSGNPQSELNRVIELERPPVFFALLHIYRVNKSANVHAIAAEIWQGTPENQEKLVAEIAPIHCAGMTSAQVRDYTRSMIVVLREEYGLEGFQGTVELNPAQCPIDPCPLR